MVATSGRLWLWVQDMTNFGTTTLIVGFSTTMELSQNGAFPAASSIFTGIFHLFFHRKNPPIWESGFPDCSDRRSMASTRRWFTPCGDIMISGSRQGVSRGMESFEMDWCPKFPLKWIDLLGGGCLPLITRGQWWCHRYTSHRPLHWLPGCHGKRR